MIRIRRSRILGWAVVIAVFVALGYLSNAVAANACKRQTQAFIDTHFGNPVVHLGVPPSFIPWIVYVKYRRRQDNVDTLPGDFIYLSVFGVSMPIQNGGVGQNY
jgi:hypothetical protein